LDGSPSPSLCVRARPADYAHARHACPTISYPSRPRSSFRRSRSDRARSPVAASPRTGSSHSRDGLSRALAVETRSPVPTVMTDPRSSVARGQLVSLRLNSPFSTRPSLDYSSQKCPPGVGGALSGTRLARRHGRLGVAPRHRARRPDCGHSSPAAHCAFPPSAPLRALRCACGPPRLLATCSSVRAPFRSRCARSPAAPRFPPSKSCEKPSSPQAALVSGPLDSHLGGSLARAASPRCSACPVPLPATPWFALRSESLLTPEPFVRSFRLRSPC